MQANDKIQEIFLESCLEQLKDVESLLLDLESAKGDEFQERVTRIFRAAHSIKGDAGSMGLEHISGYAHAIENVLQLVRERLLPVSTHIINELLHGFDRLRALITAPNQGVDAAMEQDFSRLEKLLDQVDEQEPPSAAQGNDNTAPPSQPGEETAPSEEEASEISQIAESFAAQDKITRVTIPAVQLDILVDRVGELSIAQSRLGRMARSDHESRFLGVAEEIESLCNQLRDQVLGLRLLPLQISFTKYRRLVRDLCADLGKNAAFIMHGQNTELDKKLIEELNTPLIHLLRNAVDHGIEPPDVRERTGKEKQGRIELSARQQGSDVVIEISDDGAGIDGDRLERLARQRGLLPEQAPGHELTDDEKLQLIFLPGLTTAEKVDAVSGRGVGMDAVKASVQALRGTIEIASKQDQGATFRIQVPISMAIIDCLRVEAGGEDYFIHLDYVQECLEHHPRADHENDFRELSLRGEFLPLVCLRRFFAIPGEQPAASHIVVVKTNVGRFGVIVDQIVGQHQAVLRQLGNAVGKVDGILGATVTEQGTMGLILDMPSLADAAQQEEEQRWG